MARNVGLYGSNFFSAVHAFRSTVVTVNVHHDLTNRSIMRNFVCCSLRLGEHSVHYIESVKFTLFANGLAVIVDTRCSC